MWSTSGNLIGSDDGIKTGSTDGKVIGAILWNTYGIKLRSGVGT